MKKFANIWQRSTDRWTRTKKQVNKQRTVYLPYNLIVASMPPILFFDMHLYPPKSGLCKCFMVSVIWIAYIELSVSCIVYLSFGIIISPIVLLILWSCRAGRGGVSEFFAFIVREYCYPTMDLVRLVCSYSFPWYHIKTVEHVEWGWECKCKRDTDEKGTNER